MSNRSTRTFKQIKLPEPPAYLLNTWGSFRHRRTVSWTLLWPGPRHSAGWSTARVCWELRHCCRTSTESAVCLPLVWVCVGPCCRYLKIFVTSLSTVFFLLVLGIGDLYPISHLVLILLVLVCTIIVCNLYTNKKILDAILCLKPSQ